ncbi:MAG TPA: sigma-70 family RNA polymerase sigma factor [Chloroflexota bacterium]|nr:sigma-70 family RNA polymerase sigma factor [Chloroflexota bacterium]
MLEWAARLRQKEVADTSSPHRTVAEAYRNHVEAVYRFVYRKVGNRETAEDLTAEVFTKALQWLQADRPSQSIQAWLFATARTTIVDYWRRHVDDSVDISALENLLFSPGSDAETGIDNDHDRRRVEQILGALPERESAVLRLRFLRGYSLAEAAQELGTTEGNIKVMQHRALKRAATIRWDGDGTR